jgi:membrane associated rhomboid family serine protease
MIPLRDAIRPRTFPFVNIALILINLLVWLFQLSLGNRGEAFVMHYGLVPVRFFWGLRHDIADSVVPVFSSMFLHGGWFHVIGNMWFLYIFGDNVEDRIGHLQYLFFYLFCGIGAAMAQTLLNPQSAVPMVGASGAIAGVLGGYFLLFPHSRILTLIPIFIFLQFVEIPAFVFLILWFLLQFVMGSSSHGGEGGVAWWAHIGGFIAGLVLVLFFKKSEPKNLAYWE